MQSLGENKYDFIVRKYRVLVYHCKKENVHKYGLDDIMTETSHFMSGLRLNPKISGEYHIQHMIKFDKTNEETVLYSDCHTKEDFIKRAIDLYPILNRIYNGDITSNEYISDSKYRLFDLFVESTNPVKFKNSIICTRLYFALEDIYMTYHM